MRRLIIPSLLIAITISTSSCFVSLTTVKGGEIGVKRTNGKIKSEPLSAGIKLYSPVFTTIVKIPTTTINKKVNLNIPSKEGLTINAEISILYRVVAEKAPDILEHIGKGYESVVIMPVFRSALANTSAKFYAKDMHSGKRAEIENTVRDLMMQDLKDRGFVIEAVLLKRIILPKGLSQAIENKLKAEQEAQQMEFTLQKQKKEAERHVIEAEGKKKVAIIDAEAEKERKVIDAQADKQAEITRAEGTKKANELISESLTEKVLKNNAIEAFKKLSTSDNAKTIITDGSGQVINVEK